MAIIIENIKEENLRVAVWMLNSGKTKKSICEFLNIKYNTARLDKILTSFKQILQEQEELKKTNRKKVFSSEEKDLIVRKYLELNSMSKVAEEFFISPARVKKILIEKEVPIKSRKTVLVNHITQNLDSPFSIGDVAFSRIHKSKCSIVKRYDEDYVEYLKNGIIKTVDNPYIPEGDKDTVNFSTYWILDDGTNIGLLSSVESLIKSIETVLILEGQEFYRIKVQSEDGDFFAYCKREDLYKV